MRIWHGFLALVVIVYGMRWLAGSIETGNILGGWEIPYGFYFIAIGIVGLIQAICWHRWK